MRGTAFYRARDALEQCKRQNMSVLVRSSEEDGLTDETLNTLLHLIQSLEDSWTERQREVLSYYRLHPDDTYERLGNHFGVSRQSIRDIVRAGDWKLIREAEILLHRWLGSIALQG
jgi:DNA-directed RNA polymerase sigma subunit (sigma70/sigma32)